MSELQIRFPDLVNWDAPSDQGIARIELLAMHGDVEATPANPLQAAQSVIAALYPRAAQAQPKDKAQIAALETLIEKGVLYNVPRSQWPAMTQVLVTLMAGQGPAQARTLLLSRTAQLVAQANPKAAQANRNFAGGVAAGSAGLLEFISGLAAHVVETEEKFYGQRPVADQSVDRSIERAKRQTMQWLGITNDADFRDGKRAIEVALLLTNALDVGRGVVTLMRKGPQVLLAGRQAGAVGTLFKAGNDLGRVERLVAGLLNKPQLAHAMTPALRRELAYGLAQRGALQPDDAPRVRALLDRLGTLPEFKQDVAAAMEAVPRKALPPARQYSVSTSGKAANTTLGGATFEVDGAAATREAAQRFRLGDPPGEVVSMLARRRMVAQKNHLFGRPRSHDAVTDLGAKGYQVYRQRSLEMLAQRTGHSVALMDSVDRAKNVDELRAALQGQPALLQTFEKELRELVERHGADGLARGYFKNLFDQTRRQVFGSDVANTGEVAGKLVKLTNLSGLTPYKGLGVLHVHVKEIPKIRAYVEQQLIPAFMNEPARSRQVDLLAKIHFLMANAMPWDRGSATISHWLIGSLAEARGIALPALKKDVQLDWQALLMNEGEFIKAFRGYFVSPPH